MFSWNFTAKVMAAATQLLIAVFMLTAAVGLALFGFIVIKVVFDVLEDERNERKRKKQGGDKDDDPTR